MTKVLFQTCCYEHLGITVHVWRSLKLLPQRAWPKFWIILGIIFSAPLCLQTNFPYFSKVVWINSNVLDLKPVCDVSLFSLYRDEVNSFEILLKICCKNLKRLRLRSINFLSAVCMESFLEYTFVTQTQNLHKNVFTHLHLGTHLVASFLILNSAILCKPQR